MFYLIETYWVWFVVAVIVGGAVGYWTSSTKDPSLHGFGWLRWVAIAFGVGLIVAIFNVLPDRAGLYLETLLGVVFSYVVGSLVGGLLRKAWSLVEAPMAPGAGHSSEPLTPTIDEAPSVVTAAAAEHSPVEPIKATEDAREAVDVKADEAARWAVDAKAAEAARWAVDAKAAEDVRRAVDAKAAEDARRAADAKAAEDVRRAADAKAAEDVRRAADAKAAEDARRAADAKAAEDARRAADVKAAEDARRAADVKAVEDARRVADAKTARSGRRAATTKAASETGRPAEAEARRAASAKSGRRVGDAKAADESRRAMHAQAAEEVRRAADAEAAAEARRAADERARQAVHARAAEEVHRAADAEARRAAEAEARRAAAEAARQAVHAQAAKEVYRAADAEAAAEARRAADAKAAMGRRLTETKPKEAPRAASSKPAEAPHPTARVEPIRPSPTSTAPAPPVASGAPSKPVGIDAPLNGKADDLKLIKGIGAKNEKICNDLGIYHFAQIADWSSDEAAWVGQHMAFPGRVEREHWILQAKLLASGGDTEHSAGVKAGTIALDEAADAPLDEAQTATLRNWLPEQAAPVENETRHAGRRPYGLLAPRDGQRDNLKRIRGIGPQNEGRLNGIGIWHYSQIAAWSAANVKWVASYLAASGRIEREKWIDQAKELAAGRGTESSRRTTTGKNPTIKIDNAHGQRDPQVVEPHKEG
jgi:predicted flap endonuclease-1-like 5' DNA nuclease